MASSNCDITTARSLDGWLRAVGARFLWSQDIRPGDWAVEAYAVNGRVVLVQDWGEGGWQLYLPACDANDTARTLDAANRRLGLAESGAA